MKKKIIGWVLAIVAVAIMTFSSTMAMSIAIDLIWSGGDPARSLPAWPLFRVCLIIAFALSTRAIWKISRDV